MVVPTEASDVAAIPEVLPTPHRELWPNADARKLKATATFLATRKVALLMICAACHAAQQGPDANIVWGHGETGEVIAACPCTRRILEGVYR